MKHSKTTNRNKYINSMFLLGGMVVGALLTSVVYLKPLQKSKLERAKALETTRNRTSVSVGLEFECRSLKNECDMLQAKCVQLTEEMAQLKRKVR